MILIDANIFFYAAGDDEQHKGPSVEFLRAVAEDALDAAVDARILEEILQRYRRLEMPAAGRRVCALVQRIVPTVLPISIDTLGEANRILEAQPKVATRNALHAAVARLEKAEAFVSFDDEFDSIVGVRRQTPREALAQLRRRSFKTSAS